MYCPVCGTEITDGSGVCPVCAPHAPASPRPPVAPARAEITDENAKGKGYAAIMSALFVFPTLICFAFDYLFRDNTITWSAYVLGLAMCLWMFIVLPALKPKRPALTVSVCLGVITVYLLFLAYINKNAGWYVNYALPICLMLTISSAIISLLVSYKVIKGQHIITAVSGQAGLFFVGIEILFDMQKRGEFKIGWSLILLVAAISAMAINEAVAYASRLNKTR